MLELELPWDRQPDQAAQWRQEFGAPAWLFHRRHAPVVLASTLTATVCSDGVAAQSTRVDATTGTSLQGPSALVLEDFTAFWYGIFDTVGGLGSGNYAAAFSTDDYLNSSDVTAGRDNFLFGPVHSDVGPFVQLTVAGTGDYRTFSLAAGVPVFLAVSRRGTVGSVFLNGEQVGAEFAVGSGVRVFENLRLGCQRTTNTENNFSSAKHVLAGVVRKAWSSKQQRAAAANPWQLFAPRRLQIPVYVASGGSFSDSRAEALAFAETVSAVVQAAVARSEALTLTDTPTSSAQFSAARAEALALADTGSSVLATSAAATEALALSESAATGAIQSASTAEALSLADAVSTTVTFVAAGAEALGLADAVAAVLQAVATAAESIALAAGHDAVIEGDLTGAVAETLALADTGAATAQLAAVGAETLMLADSSAPIVAYVAAVQEALSLVATADGAVTTTVVASLAEALSLAETSSGLVISISAGHVTETVYVVAEVTLMEVAADQALVVVPADGGLSV